MSDLFDAKTLDYYSGDAESYLASRPDNVSRHLHELLERLAPGACILELGCGAGRDSKAMIAAGFDVDPTDGVTEIAAIAAERLQRDVRVMRFDELAEVGVANSLSTARMLIGSASEWNGNTASGRSAMPCGAV